jgi:hypothetical protein
MQWLRSAAGEAGSPGHQDTRHGSPRPGIAEPWMKAGETTLGQVGEFSDLFLTLTSANGSVNEGRTVFSNYATTQPDHYQQQCRSVRSSAATSLSRVPASTTEEPSQAVVFQPFDRR